MSFQDKTRTNLCVRCVQLYKQHFASADQAEEDEEEEEEKEIDFPAAKRPVSLCA